MQISVLIFHLFSILKYLPCLARVNMVTKWKPEFPLSMSTMTKKVGKIRLQTYIEHRRTYFIVDRTILLFAGAFELPMTYVLLL